MVKIISASLVALALGAGMANAGSGVKVGLLTCGIDGGIGFIIGSSKAVECVYEPAGGGDIERYEGRINKLGIDIGITHHTSVAWAVFAPGKTTRGALKGGYGGASAEATLGVGVGANVLVGGFRKTISLQPVSVQAQTGLDIAAGIAALNLRYIE